MDKDENYLGFLINIKNFAQMLFKYVGDLAHLAQLEAELAKRSLVKIVFLLFFAVILLISTWTGVSILIVASLVSMGFSLIIGLAITIGIQILLLGLVALLLLRLKKNLLFPITRKQLSFKEKE